MTAPRLFDVLAPSDGGSPRVVPFVTAGAGLFQTREELPRETYTSREGAFTAGGGVRTALGDRATAGVDVRVGWELHVRVNGTVGIRLGAAQP